MLLACGLALACTTLGCGGGDEPGGGSVDATGLRVEEEFWDAARTVRKSRSTTRYGKPVGDYEEFHQNGMPAVTGQYSEDGLQTGEWKRTYPNGLEAKRETYVAGQLSGEVLEWYPDGSLKSRAFWEGGKRVGEWTSYHQGPDAAIMEQSTYEDDKIVGTFKAFYPSGQLYMEVPHVDGKPEGTQRAYYASGELERELEQVGGVPHGMEILYHEGGMKLAENQWVNGAQTGEAKSWWANGSLGMRGRREAGLPVGLWRRWHPNGNPQLFGTYDEGKPSGEWRSWYEDGALERVATFDESGAPTGLFREWWPDGSRKRYGTAAGGTHQQILFTDVIFVWDEQGAIVPDLSGHFENGERIGPLVEEDLARAAELAAEPDLPAPRDYGPEALNEENG